MNDIKTVIAEYSEQFNRRLPDFFSLPDGPEKRVVEAMKYAVTNGGKRLDRKSTRLNSSHRHTSRMPSSA